MRWLSALVLASLLAGCAGQLPGSFDPCPVPTASLRWREAGVYASLPDAAAQAGLSFSPMPPREGEPINFMLREAEDGPLRLLGVEWTREGRPIVGLHAQRPGEFALIVRAPFGDPAILPELRAFLDELGLGDSPERPAWERAILHAPRDHWPPIAIIVATPDVAALQAREAANLTLSDESIGGFTLEGSGWRIHLGTETRTLYVEGVRIMVDARDHVLVIAPVPKVADAWPPLQEKINQTWQTLGLPPPSFREASSVSEGC